MSYYVHRTRDDGREGWIGPIRSDRQADRERDAWESCDWHAVVMASTPEIKKAVRTWQREADRNRERSQW